MSGLIRIPRNSLVENAVLDGLARGIAGYEKTQGDVHGIVFQFSPTRKDAFTSAGGGIVGGLSGRNALPGINPHNVRKKCAGCDAGRGSGSRPQLGSEILERL